MQYIFLLLLVVDDDNHCGRLSRNLNLLDLLSQAYVMEFLEMDPLLLLGIYIVSIFIEDHIGPSFPVLSLSLIYR